jgi:hypothetical protein
MQRIANRKGDISYIILGVLIAAAAAALVGHRAEGVATDQWSTWAVAPNGPARNAAVITPHATDELVNITRGIYVAGGGDLVVRFADGSTDVTIEDVPPGSILPFCVRAVRNTSTATGLIALY